LKRTDGRKPGEIREVKITRSYTSHPAGSVLIRFGETIVLCTATWSEGVPEWRTGQGSGWLTAEYDMLPGSTAQRRKRNRTDGRTQEIQRLIGRSLRAVVDLDRLGENSISVDCDVIQADGGTRTASITGAYVAVCDAVSFALRNKFIAVSPIRQAVAAVSVGKIDGRLLLDLNYREDVEAQVDMNVVMTASGGFVEVQGTGEEATFARRELDGMLGLAEKGIRRLLELQQASLSGRKRKK
jgi:ribonuclease PH